MEKQVLTLDIISHLNMEVSTSVLTSTLSSNFKKDELQTLWPEYSLSAGLCVIGLDKQNSLNLLPAEYLLMYRRMLIAVLVIAKFHELKGLGRSKNAQKILVSALIRIMSKKLPLSSKEILEKTFMILILRISQSCNKKHLVMFPLSLYRKIFLIDTFLNVKDLVIYLLTLSAYSVTLFMDTTKNMDLISDSQTMLQLGSKQITSLEP